MKTEKEIRELFELHKGEDTPANEIFNISLTRVEEICKQIDERMEQHKIVYEDIIWILNNPDFTDDEKLLTLIERGGRFGVFCYRNSPKMLEFHSTIEGAMNDKS